MNDQTSGINLQKLTQELSNIELAHKEVKARLETARALCSHLVMIQGPLVTVNTLKGIPVASNVISKMNIWSAMTLHLNTLAQETKRSRIMKELESSWTVETLMSYNKQVDIYLCMFRQFIEETNMIPSPDNNQYKHYQDFMSSFTDHVKKMIFQPGEVLTLGVLFAHGRNCSKFSTIKRMLTVLYLTLNLRVKCSLTNDNKADIITQYLQVGEEECRESLFREVQHIIAHHYYYTCPCPFHSDLNIPPNWLEFEQNCPKWNEVESELKAAKGAQRMNAQYVPDVEIRQELQYKAHVSMVRHLTNTFMFFRPVNKSDQELH